MKLKQTLITVCFGLIGMGPASAAVPEQDAAKLGGELTPFGAEKAASADGIIPEWSGGLTTIPPSYQMGSGKRPNPWPDEKPYLTISKANMAEYADKLTPGAQALLEKYGDQGYVIKVWPTHRSFSGPDWYYDNTRYNATHAKLTGDGLKLEGAKAGTPFPIPQNGVEVLWNHLLRWEGTHLEAEYETAYMDKHGKRVLATAASVAIEYPFYNPDKDYGTGFNDFYMIRVDYDAPARRAGEKILVIDPTDFTKGAGRRAWQYLKGQRRVRRAPSVDFDTPNPGTAGIATYDDTFLFLGSPERYDWKLIGKKEMYVSYNSYDLVFNASTRETLGPKFVNPEYNRWELHRVWVIEATLKKGSRHIYHRRVMYIDEDSWATLATDLYDGRDQLWRVGFAFETPLYEQQSGLALMFGHYDLQSGIYYINGSTSDYNGVLTDKPQKPANFWTGKGLSASGIR